MKRIESKTYRARRALDKIIERIAEAIPAPAVIGVCLTVAAVAAVAVFAAVVAAVGAVCAAGSPI